MLGLEHFNNKIFRKYILVFGDLFNDIYIKRYKQDGTVVNHMKVPLIYLPSQKHVRLDEHNPILAKNQIQLPVMTYDMTSLTMDTERLLNPTNKLTRTIDNNHARLSMFQPIPYNFDFEVNITGKTSEDVMQIVEQILPYFGPTFTPTVNIDNEIGLVLDTPVSLTAITPNSDFQGDVNEPETISWTLNFVMKGLIYGSKAKQGVIKRAITDLIPVPGSGPVTADEIDTFGRASRITITPGMTANGEPTTVYEDSIPYQEINKDDNWDYVIQVETFDDNKKRDPIDGNDK